VLAVLILQQPGKQIAPRIPRLRVFRRFLAQNDESLRPHGRGNRQYRKRA